MISVAGASTPNAVGLVYVAAFALDEGEAISEIYALRRHAHRRRRPSEYPVGDGKTATELTIAPELPGGVRRRPAGGRHPCQAASVRRDLRGSRRGGGEVATALLVRDGDGRQRDPRRRASATWRVDGAKTIEVDASHSIARSQPAAVSELIRTAGDESSAVRAASLFALPERLEACPALPSSAEHVRAEIRIEGGRMRRTELC